MDRNSHRGRLLIDSLQIQIRNFENFFSLEVLEHNDFIHTVEELGAEEFFHLLYHLVLHALVCSRVIEIRLHIAKAKRLVHLDRANTHVGSHDDERIPEVDRSPLAISQLSIFHHLKEDVEYFWVGLLNLIEENHAVWVSSDLFRQLSALIVTYVSRRGSQQSADCKSLHILGHVDSNHVGLFLIKVACKRLCEFGLSNSSWSQEDKASHRSLWIFESGTSSSDGSRNGNYRIVLTDDSLVQVDLHSKQFLALSLNQLRDGDTCPALDDPGYFRFTNNGFNLRSVGPLFFSDLDAGFQLIPFLLKFGQLLFIR